MIQKLIQTESESSTTILRLALGVMILPHGLQKTLGWFGGNGFSNTMDYFTQNMGIPSLFALLAILAESLGGVALIVGIGTRIAALGVGFVMLVAGFMHLENGFFMNWFGQKQGEGFEFHIIALAIAFAVAVKGAGALGFDNWIQTQITKNHKGV